MKEVVVECEIGVRYFLIELSQPHNAIVMGFPWGMHLLNPQCFVVTRCEWMEVNT